MHDASVGWVEYLPATHGVHAIAFAPDPVFVIEPGWHAEHTDWRSLSWYSPGEHATFAPPLHLWPRGQTRSSCFSSMYVPGGAISGIAVPGAQYVPLLHRLLMLAFVVEPTPQ